MIKLNENVVQLEGEESNLRLFHYLCVAVGNKGNYWTFKTITEQEVLKIHNYINTERYERLSPIGKNKANAIMAVYEVALKGGYKIIELDKDVVNLGERMNREKEITLLSNYLTSERLGRKRRLHIELIHLGFFANYFIEELRVKNEKIAIGKEVYALRNNEIIRSCIKILTKLQEQFNIGEDSWYELGYYLNQIISENKMI